MCPKCEVPIEGVACSLCGTPVYSDPEEQKRVVMDLHAKVLAASTSEEKSSLLRNAPLPEDVEILIEAGLRCVPLLESFEPGDSAAARLQAIVVKLRLLPEDDRIAKAIQEFERHLRAQRRSNLHTGIGCTVLVLAVVGLVVFLLIKYVF